MPKSKQINIALLGLGKLGLGFYKIFLKKREEIARETGLQLNISRILVKNTRVRRPSFVDASLITTDFNDILNDTSIQIAIDAIGGIEPTFSMISKLIERRVNIVSANRAMLSSKMQELADLSLEKKVVILPEPALGGGVPIISTIKQDLIANNIVAMYGILSGTSNYILSEMTEKQISLREVLKMPEIQKMAETLSVIDYEGSDAAQKVAILASAAFGMRVNYLNVFAEGISDISVFDIQCAADFGYEFKLLAIIKVQKDGFEIHVHPTLVPEGHPLTLIRNDYNAYFMYTDLIGEYMIYGKGVGVEASSSLILRDLVGIGNLLRNYSSIKTPYRLNWSELPVKPMEDIVSAYYIRFPCVDQPGVVGTITTELGNAKINIASAHAEVNKKIHPDLGYVHILVDEAQEVDILNAINHIKKMPIIKGQIKFYRILKD